MPEKKKKIIIFGVSNTERSIAAYLLENYDNVVAVVDNDKKKKGK